MITNIDKKGVSLFVIPFISMLLAIVLLFVVQFWVQTGWREACLFFVLCIVIVGVSWRIMIWQERKQ